MQKNYESVMIINEDFFKINSIIEIINCIITMFLMLIKEVEI